VSVIARGGAVRWAWGSVGARARPAWWCNGSVELRWFTGSDYVIECVIVIIVIVGRTVVGIVG
jgi:hypothetical protein